jgi:hypothetical protein
MRGPRVAVYEVPENLASRMTQAAIVRELASPAQRTSALAWRSLPSVSENWKP